MPPLTTSVPVSLQVKDSAVTVTPASPPAGTVNYAYPGFTFTAKGGSPPYTWAATGMLPPGLTLGTDGSLSGTPTQLGTFSFAAVPTDSAQTPVTGPALPVQVMITSELHITSRAPPTATFGVQYDAGWITTCVLWLSPGQCAKLQRTYRPGFPLAAGGGQAPLTWSWSAQPGSSLPPGLSISGSYIEGVPAHTGSYAVVISVMDAASDQASLSTNITVAENSMGPKIAALPGPQGATLNQPYSYTFAVTGNAVTVSASGALPPGLAPVTAAGVLAGTPTAIGTWPIVVQATDGAGQSVTQNFSIQVFPHGFAPTGSMQVARDYNTGTLLSSGLVLLAAGEDRTTDVIASAELFDPATQTFTATGNLKSARGLHTATLLCDLSSPPCANPKVLIAGGLGVGGPQLASAEIFDPSTGAFTPTGSLHAARFQHTATLLGNGHVLVAGGATIGGSLVGVAELFNPATGSFATIGSLVTPRVGHTATLLGSGKVLLAGGQAAGGNTASAELYDPGTGTFTATGTMLAPRFYHTATLLTNGQVLMVGGSGGGDSAELYDPSSGTFAATGGPRLWRSQHAAALLPDGTVLVAGGWYGLGNVSLADAELYDPQSGTFSETGGLQNPFLYPVMTPLGASGRVLMTGSFPVLPPSAAAEVYQ
jgi:hypothetical protein